jgi:hypothetical protein
MSLTNSNHDPQFVQALGRLGADKPKILSRLVVSLLITVCCCAVAHGSERVFVGHVTEIALLAYGTDRCPAVCPTGERGHALAQVCVSNSCGCQETRIAVDEVIVGASTPKTILIPQSLGEWCTPEFPLGSKVLVTQGADNALRWSPVSEVGGVLEFDASPFTDIGGVKASDLTTHSDSA